MNNPLYESMPTIKSLGGKYSIYKDRIELKHPLLKDFIIKKEDLISIKVFYPPVIKTIFKNKALSLKLDLADINVHVGIKRKNGIFKYLRFTPKNPEEFVSKVKEIFNL